MGVSTDYVMLKDVNIDELPGLMKQVAENMQKYPDDILLTRVGDFFEAYFDDAIELSRLTGIVLTAKTVGKQGEKIVIPMSGIPHRNLNDYANKLVNEDRRVVVVDQLEDPKNVKNGQLVKRGVIRIMTSSTVVEDCLLNEYVNNYLCVLYKSANDYGLCFSDISTGEIFMTSVDSLDSVLNEISRYKPSELLLNSACHNELNSLILKRLKLHINLTIKDEFFNEKNIFEKIERSFKIDSIDKIKYNAVSELYSLYALLSYVDYTQCLEVDYGKLPISYSMENYMIFDIDTRRNLELCENIIDRKKNGTLLSVLDKTSTVMGSRLLRHWIEKPLVSKSNIEYRLSAVEELISNYDVCKNMINSMSGIFDISRIMGRLKLNRSVPRDLISLKESLRRLPALKQELGKLSSPYIVNLYENFNSFEDLFYLLDMSLCDDPVSDIKEGIVIQSGFNKELDTAREMVENANKFLMELEGRERESTGIKNLKVVNVGGVCTIEVSNAKGNSERVPSHYQIEKSLKNCIRYKTEESRKLELDLLNSLDKSKNLEIELYDEVKQLVLSELNGISLLCEILSTLDVLCSLSQVAKENGYVRPELNIEGNLVIRDGRHPVVEKVLKDTKFISNDIEMNMSSDRFLLITGPNMAGKSTYMRQVALITIMAHIGSFVPASYANISITDKIFTRIGASDDIASGRSTYMVEMEEVCNILLNSTPKSLVLLDEVGRGTSTSDGLSIAQAITEYIHNTVGCKTLFATHYHELIRLENNLLSLKNYHMSVGRTDEGELEFLRKIKKGGLSDSYGIDVARLAGIPDEVIDRAWNILNNIEDKAILLDEPVSNDEKDLLKEIKGMDISELSPISSYKYLADLIARVNSL